MGIIVRNSDDIAWALGTVPPEGRIFCFFAFDDRPSHSVVLEFLADSIEWIDALSANAGIFSLVFSRKWQEIVNPPTWMYMEQPLTSEESQYLDNLPRRSVYINPTLELAKKFGVKPRDLPGLLIFDAIPAPDISSNTIFIPLDLSLFTSKNIRAAESILTEIFSCIEEITEGKPAKRTDQIISSISQSISQIHQQVQLLPEFQGDIAKIIRDTLRESKVKAYTPSQETSTIRSQEEKSEKIRRLIGLHERRLQKLREQEAIYGSAAEPHIVMEIEDIEEKISSLKLKLRFL